MKKVSLLLCAVLAVAMLFSMAACSSSPAATKAAEAAAPASSAAEASALPAESTEADAVAREFGVMPLPVNEAGLETVVAKQWLKYSEKTDTLEGPSFDREGNLYFVAPYEGRVLKVTPPSTEVTVIYDDNAESKFVSLDIHKDGRLFLCDIKNGKIVAMNPDGSGKVDIATGITNADDICFDSEGNIYCTQLISNYKTEDGKNTGKVIKISADFKTITTLFDGYAGANGVCLSPDGTYLYTTEFSGNTLIRTDMNAAGEQLAHLGSFPLYRYTGPCGPDSICCDAAGNVYQALFRQGRMLILDKNGVPFKNVLLENRGEFLKCANIAIKPGTNEAYLTCAGSGGSGIFTFTAPAEGMNMYAHQ